MGSFARRDFPVIPRDEKLKAGLVPAILFHRIEELGNDPDDARAIALIDWRALPWKSEVENLVNDYFRLRLRDRLLRPSTPSISGSKFLEHVALLMVGIEDLFQARATETAIEVAGRVMRYEGWNAKYPRFEKWKKAVQQIGESPSKSKDRAQAYQTLFQSEWEYRLENVLQFEDALEDEELWGKSL